MAGVGKNLWLLWFFLLLHTGGGCTYAAVPQDKILHNGMRLAARYPLKHHSPRLKLRSVLSENWIDTTKNDFMPPQVFEGPEAPRSEQDEDMPRCCAECEVNLEGHTWYMAFGRAHCSQECLDAAQRRHDAGPPHS